MEIETMMYGIVHSNQEKENRGTLETEGETEELRVRNMTTENLKRSTPQRNMQIEG